MEITTTTKKICMRTSLLEFFTLELEKTYMVQPKKSAQTENNKAAVHLEKLLKLNDYK